MCVCVLLCVSVSRAVCEHLRVRVRERKSVCVEREGYQEHQTLTSREGREMDMWQIHTGEGYKLYILLTSETVKLRAHHTKQRGRRGQAARSERRRAGIQMPDRFVFLPAGAPHSQRD